MRDPSAGDPRSRQLPSGRHGLSREFVAANQRERILDAVAQISSRRGYWSMSLDDIAAASGTSRRTFYTLFRDKEEAFLATCEATATALITAVYAHYDDAEPLVVRGRRCMEAALGYLSANPEHAEVLIVQVLAAGPAAVHMRDEALQLLAALVNRAVAELEPAPPVATAEAVIGGIYQVLYRRVLAGHADDLLSVLPELLFMLLVPFVGRDEASAAARLAADAVHG